MRQHRNPRELAIMRNRRAEAITLSSSLFSREHFASKPLNFWRKRHPFDCGRPGCGVCHSEPKGRPDFPSGPLDLDDLLGGTDGKA